MDWSDEKVKYKQKCIKLAKVRKIVNYKKIPEWKEYDSSSTPEPEPIQESQKQIIDMTQKQITEVRERLLK